MNSSVRALMAGLVLLPAAAVDATDNRTFDAALAGKRCTEENQQLACEFHVGRDLYFAIVGIGQRDTAVTFFTSDWDGDYYATYGLMHGCVIVKPGAKAPKSTLPMFAFVSPKNGKVYPSWGLCMDAL